MSKLSGLSIPKRTQLWESVLESLRTAQASSHPALILWKQNWPVSWG